VTDSLKQHLTLGRELYARHDYPGAEPHLKAVLGIRDDLPDVHHMLGVIHHDRGELDDARLCFQRALLLNPDYTEAALNLSIVCNELGAYSDAKEVVGTISERARHGHRIDPYARGKVANLHGEVARAYEELGMWPEAIDEYRRGLGLCPDYSDLRTRLAMCLRSDGEVDEARKELEIAVTINPQFVPARVALGVMYMTLGRHDEAALAWREALAIDPTHRPARVYLRLLDEPDARPSKLPPPEVIEAEGDGITFELITDTK
jgi:tetratricopeptide (TPR) repeat protein